MELIEERSYFLDVMKGHIAYNQMIIACQSIALGKIDEQRSNIGQLQLGQSLC